MYFISYNISNNTINNITTYTTIFIIIYNITILLFGNEIIKYFNLDNKYPWLTKLIKLRYTFQRYYFIWCLFLLIIICGTNLYVSTILFFR